MLLPYRALRKPTNSLAHLSAPIHLLTLMLPKELSFTLFNVIYIIIGISSIYISCKSYSFFLRTLSFFKTIFWGGYKNGKSTFFGKATVHTQLKKK
jgi:hypothetical protein